MNRHLFALLILPLGLFVACASEKASAPQGNTDPTPGVSAGAATNPIEGIGPAKVVLETGAYTDGPVWSAKEGVLFFTTPLGQSGLYRMTPDGAAMKVRDGDPATGAQPIGNTIDKAGTLITVEAKRITKNSAAPDAGAPTAFATGYNDGDAGVASFDTLNDAVVSQSGTIYATDPGYFATPMANRLYRVSAAGKATVVEEFMDIPRPNGVALTPDGKGLYVGFTQPVEGTKPFVSKYTVNADGTLGEHVKFIDLDKDASPDGIEVDQAGNVFVATKG
ncbi:MAG TPA: SMP-30/gluconolactonase/LRE family protein, partial [Labilithrix sp.]|nr:SMP-30/gluconolactonase/LRE family protein [Labilithrix sp.]